jgi:HemK-related putative methylase
VDYVVGPDAEHWLRQLAAVLDELGYVELYGRLIEPSGPLAPFAASVEAARRRIERAGGELASSLRLLALGEPVPHRSLPAALAEALDGLVATGCLGGFGSIRGQHGTAPRGARSEEGPEGALRRRAARPHPAHAGPNDEDAAPHDQHAAPHDEHAGAHDEIDLGGLVVVVLPSGIALAPAPYHYGAGRPAVYLGSDSLMLAALLGDVRGRRVLDVGSGCGVVGLAAARAGAAHVTMVDLSVKAAALSACNAVLAGLDEHVRVVVGDMFEPVEDERFDLVVSLPPYLPDLPVEGGGCEVLGPSVGGGPDGLAMVQRLIDEAPRYLAPRGSLLLLMQALARGDRPLVVEALERVVARERAASDQGKAGQLGARVVVSGWHRAGAFVASLARDAARLTGLPESELLAEYRDIVGRLGADAVCTASVRLASVAAEGRPAAAGSGLEPGTVRIVCAEPLVGPETELVAREGTRVELAAGTFRIGGPSSDELADAKMAALVASCDAPDRAARIVERAFAPLAGAEGLGADLVEEGLERLGALVRSGHLVLGEGLYEREP